MLRPHQEKNVFAIGFGIKVLFWLQYLLSTLRPLHDAPECPAFRRCKRGRLAYQVAPCTPSQISSPLRRLLEYLRP